MHRFSGLRDIRSRKQFLPVLVLTATSSLDERIAGLDAGADDNMTKPFALAELSARLRALLRRGAPRETVLRVSDLEVDTVRRTVRRAGVNLRAQRYAALIGHARQRSSTRNADADMGGSARRVLRGARAGVNSSGAVSIWLCETARRDVRR